MNELEAQFHEQMLDIYNQAAALGYRPTYFLRMVNQLGGLQAAKQLLKNKDEIHEGFTQLYLLKRLDLSVEATAMKPEYRELFNPDEIQCAKARLQELEYPVE